MHAPIRVHWVIYNIQTSIIINDHNTNKKKFFLEDFTFIKTHFELSRSVSYAGQKNTCTGSILCN